MNGSEKNKFDLIQWEQMRYNIEQARDIVELQQLSDRLEAIRILAKQSKQSLEVQNKIAEYRLRVERKKGEWLQENINHEGAAKQGWNESMDSTRLSDIGITKDDSSRAQRIAKLDDEDFEKFIEETKDTNKELTLAGAVKLAKQIIREEKIEDQIRDLEENPPQMPNKEYNVIVIDPPWKYGTKYDPDTRRGTCPYPEMSQEQLLNIEMPAAKDCVLWLWVTNGFLKDAFELLDHWGFAYKNILTWDKVNIGVGYWLRNVTEHCILAVKGSPVWTNKTYSTIIHEKRTEHSKKPEAFYNMVDKICYGSKIEIFSRQKREGWDVFGDEVEENDKKD